MSRDQTAEQAPSITLGALPPASPSIAALAAQNTELETAIRVAQRMLADFGDSRRDGFSYPEAFGATREALRLVLRALDSEPDAGSFPRSGDVFPGSRKNPSELGGRCPAAHPEDPTPCDGPASVTVTDATNAGADGCEHHAARLLASLDGGRVYALPDAPEGAAIRVFNAADSIRPFPWHENAPRTRPEHLSRAENRCGRCRWTFDPYDKRFDGHARHGDTNWCRRCVDNCHEGSAEHVCAICEPKRYGGADR